MVLVSACLCGVNCKYNGGNNFNELLYNFLKQGKLIPICPEQLGGLPTPRHPAEIINGDAKDVLNGKAKVLTIEGEDVTDYFLKGAYETLKVAKSFNCKAAILKSNSPSCGKGKVYDGTFTVNLTVGNGITTELLIQNGVEVYDEKDVAAIEELLRKDELNGGKKTRIR